MSISEAEVESALHYLATSAKEYAEAEGRRTWAAEALKIEKARQMLASASKTVSERESEALTSQPYAEALKAYSEAESGYLLVKAYREAADAKIRVWQSQEASKRAANV